MATPVHGKNGSVTFTPADVSKITGWEFTSTGEIAESTGAQDTWASFLDGFTDFTASIEALAMTETDYAGDIGQEATLTLTLDTGQSISANAILTSLTETASIDDVGKVSMSFEGDAASVTYPA